MCQILQGELEKTITKLINKKRTVSFNFHTICKMNNSNMMKTKAHKKALKMIDSYLIIIKFNINYFIL